MGKTECLWPFKGRAVKGRGENDDWGQCRVKRNGKNSVCSIEDIIDKAGIQRRQLEVGSSTQMEGLTLNRFENFFHCDRR